MAGSVDEGDLPLADRELVAVVHFPQITVGDAGDLLDPLRFVLVHVEGHAAPLEKPRDSFDVHAEHVAAYVVGVVVGYERSDDLVAILGGYLEQAVDVPCRIDDERFTFLSVPEEVHEIPHLARDGVRLRDVLTGEELSKVEVAIRQAGLSGDSAASAILSRGRCKISSR